MRFQAIKRDGAWVIWDTMDEVAIVVKGAKNKLMEAEAKILVELLNAEWASAPLS